MNLSEVFRIPGPEEKVANWHVSPLIDSIAYAFSWAWVFIPLVFLTDVDNRNLFNPNDLTYIALYIFILGMVDAHRHYIIPFIYLDKQVRREFPARFLLFPALLLFVWICSPFIAQGQTGISVTMVTALFAYTILLIQILVRDGKRDKVHPALSLMLWGPILIATCLTLFTTVKEQTLAWCWVGTAFYTTISFDWQYGHQRHSENIGRTVNNFIYSLIIAVVALFTALFNEDIAAVLLGGKLSLKQLIIGVAIFAFSWNIWHFYMQKYGIMRLYNFKSTNTIKMPGWLDRAMLLCWIPLYIVWLLPRYSWLASTKLSKGKGVIQPMAEWMTNLSSVLLPITIVFVVMTLVYWCYWEWRVYRLCNRPRMTMFAGTTLMAFVFLFVDPVKAYLSFGFSHALEYMVFIWAYQRKHYHQPAANKTPLVQLLRYPILTFAGYTLILWCVFTYFRYYGGPYLFSGANRPEFLGFHASTWIAWWGIYQSMAHFYWDGFMWKMRKQAVQKHL